MNKLNTGPGKHRKDLINRHLWDWSISNYRLSKIHGMCADSVREARKKLGIQPYKRPAAKAKDPNPKMMCSKSLSIDDLKDGKKAKKKWIDRFWANVEKKSDDECWPWIGSTARGRGFIGIGELGVNFRNHIASRVSYVIHHGNIPAGLIVRHKCDNGICVNPNHLEIGTMRDNYHDASTRHGFMIGEKNFVSKYSDAQIMDVKIRHKNGERLCDISRATGVPVNSAWNAINGISWRHIKV